MKLDMRDPTNIKLVSEICEEVEAIGIECYGINDLADTAYDDIITGRVDIHKDSAEHIARMAMQRIQQA